MKTHMLADISKPVNLKGYRFSGCPYYDRCLGHAARLDWKFFACDRCPNLALEDAYESARRITPYYNVLKMIYPEFRTRYEGLVSMFHQDV